MNMLTISCSSTEAVPCDTESKVSWAGLDPTAAAKIILHTLQSAWCTLWTTSGFLFNLKDYVT